MSIKKKIVWLPYDFDTAIGINNEGSLVFDYSLEDTDHIDGGADVFNGQQSVIWNNIRLAFHDELMAMYKQLRSQGKLSYDVIEQMFEEHQGKWSEAIFNEDAWFKYIDPLIEDGNGAYLSMMQGSKAEQRKWWLYNRFRYIDSKYNAGDSLSDLIQVRGYAKSNVTVTPYADIYPTVKYGSYLVQERGHRNQPTTLVCPLDNVNDTEIYIYSASQLASVGDLSGLKVGFADFSMATRMQDIKIGDSASSYSNQNLTALTLGNNVLLKTLDVRNCSSLGTGDQKTVDISGCEIIEEVYFDGTAIQGVTLPNGGALKVLHVPSTVTNLTIMNQRNITDLTVASYANISTLRLENVPTVDTKSILRSIPASARVRLIGLYWECEDAEEIDGLLDILDTMRGLDENGNNMDTAQVSGTIHTSELTGAEIAELRTRYPYITISADHTTSQLRYYNGETLLRTETILDGGNGSYTGSTPTRAQDAHYTYSFAGWSKDTDDNTVDSDALINVVADRNVYAAYSTTVRTYTVTWKNEGGSTLETDNNVPYGTTPTYNGPTPTYDGETYRGWEPAVGPITGNTTYIAQYKPKYTVKFYNGSTLLQTLTVKEGNTATYTGTTPTNTEGTTFLGWSNTNGSHTADAVLTNITANKDVYAAFEQAVVVEEITDSWDTIIANIDNGTYATKYKVGNYKSLDLGTEGTINMQIVAMDEDELASGGTAPLTFVGMELLATKRRMNEGSTTNAGGWLNSELRGVLDSTIKPLIPSNVANRINRVNKTYYLYMSDSDKQTMTCVDSLWVPSYRELGFNIDMSAASTYGEETGVIYGLIYKDNTSRIKTLNSQATEWWVRSAIKNNYNNNPHYGYVTETGYRPNGSPPNKQRGVCLGFCLGLEQTE